MSIATVTFVAVAPRRTPKTQEARKRPKACDTYDWGLAGGTDSVEPSVEAEEAAAAAPSGAGAAGREAEDMLAVVPMGVLGWFGT